MEWFDVMLVVKYVLFREVFETVAKYVSSTLLVRHCGSACRPQAQSASTLLLLTMMDDDNNNKYDDGLFFVIIYY